jgi:hypothetical protein
MQSKPNRRRSLAYVSVVVSAVLVVTSVVFSLRSGPPSNTHATSMGQTTTSTFPTQLPGVMNSNGLEFTMSLNTTTLERGRNLTVSLSLNNTLDRNNSVVAAYDWRLTNASETNCAYNDPFRTEVFQGYYDLGNFSKGTPLVFTVFPAGGINYCLVFFRDAPLFISFSANDYIFSPLSDKAQWTANNVNSRTTMAETVLLEPPVFSTSTGVFTVVSGDMWGDLQVGHFVIEPTGP